jgi:hypothetical protein
MPDDPRDRPARGNVQRYWRDRVWDISLTMGPYFEEVRRLRRPWPSRVGDALRRWLGAGRSHPATAAVVVQATLDCFRSHVAVLRADGTIVAVNAAWDAFAARNGLAPRECGPGTNYLGACWRAAGPGSGEAHAVAGAIFAAGRGPTPDFELEYPCHSPAERRWFRVRVARLVFGPMAHILVIHDDVTQRHLAETRLREAELLLAARRTPPGGTPPVNR